MFKFLSKKFSISLLILSVAFIPLSTVAETVGQTLSTQTIRAIPKACDYGEGAYSKNSLIIISYGHEEVATIEALVNKESQKFKASSLLVREESQSTDPAIEKFNQALAASSIARSFEIKFPEAASCQGLQSIIDELATNPGIEAIHLNRLFHLDGILDGNPNDPRYPEQWALKRIKADEVWKQNIIGAGVKVGVVDSQFFANHPDIIANVSINTTEDDGVTDVDDDNNQCVDDVYFCSIYDSNQTLFPVEENEYSHGTSIASIIAATGDNNKDIIGVAPGAKIVFAGIYPQPSGTNIIKGIQYLIKRGVMVINISLAASNLTSLKSNLPQDPLYQAVAAAINAGVVVVVSAGNEGQDVDHLINPTADCSGECYSILANIPGVIAVAATNFSNTKASFSNYGANVDIAAPGVDILSLGASVTRLGQFTFTSISEEGTSFSAPLVTGAAVLIKSKYPDLSGAQISESLIKSAVPLSENIGGLLNVQDAVTYAFDNFIQVGDFSIISPAINENLTIARPKFSWTLPTKSHSYIVRVRNNDTNQDVINTTLSPSIFYPAPTELTPSLDLINGNYTIYVTATNLIGGSKTVSRSFKITLPIPVGDFNIISPAVNENFTIARPQFSWTLPINANAYDVNYNVRVRNNDTNQDVIDTTLSPSVFYPAPTELTPSIDLISGNYTIYVTAYNESGGSKTVSRSFKITLPYTVAEILSSLKIRSNSVFYNASNLLFEKLFYSELISKWYYILPNGDFYESVSGGQITTMRNGTDKLLANNLGLDAYQDIRLLPQFSSLSLDTVLAVHGLNLEIGNNSLYFNNTRTDYEKWFTGKTGYGLNAKVWYKLLPNGNLIANDTAKTVIIKLSSDYYTNVNLFTGINLDDIAMITAHNYQADSTGNTVFNWTGVSYEKWFYGKFGQAPAATWSYMTKDGSVYHVTNNVAMPVPIMKLSSEYFIEPTNFDLITETSDQFFWLVNKLDIKLRSYSANYQYNWSGQYQEKWLAGAKKAKETSTPYYYLLPDGRLYRYTGGGKSKVVVGDILIARVNPSYYNNPATIVYTAR